MQLDGFATNRPPRNAEEGQAPFALSFKLKSSVIREMGCWGVKEIINQDQPNNSVWRQWEGGRRIVNLSCVCAFVCMCARVLSAKVDSSMEPIRRCPPRPLEPGIISHVPDNKAATVGQSLICEAVH